MVVYRDRPPISDATKTCWERRFPYGMDHNLAPSKWSYGSHQLSYSCCAHCFLCALSWCGLSTEHIFEASGCRLVIHWPYDFAHRRSFYLIVMTCQAICSWCIVVLAAVEDSFFIALLNIACGHIASLKEQLENLGTDHIDENSQNLVYHKELIVCCRRFENCLRYHNHTQTHHWNVIKLYEFGMVLQYCCNHRTYSIAIISCAVRHQRIFALLLCVPSVCGERDSSVKMTSAVMLLHKLFLFFHFFSIYRSIRRTISSISYSPHFIWCLLLPRYCQHVLWAVAERMMHAVYSSQWMDQNAKCKRTFGILAERSMRPTKLYAGGLFELSLPTFVKVKRFHIFLLGSVIRFVRI